MGAESFRGVMKMPRANRQRLETGCQERILHGTCIGGDPEDKANVRMDTDESRVTGSHTLLRSPKVLGRTARAVWDNRLLMAITDTEEK